MSSSQRLYVISLGGSLIVPDTIDVSFLKEFRGTLMALMAEGYRFLVIPGGGATARRYQHALYQLGVDDAVVRDRIGIRSLEVNAELLLALFFDVAHPSIIYDNTQLPEHVFQLAIAAGAAPGRSSDAGAVELAQAARAESIINLSNIAHVYARDPKVNPEAESYARISWGDYRKLIPAAWDPGLSTPFDPVASQMAQERGLTVAILGGDTPQALARFVRSGVCDGTLISDRV